MINLTTSPDDFNSSTNNKSFISFSETESENDNDYKGNKKIFKIIKNRKSNGISKYKCSICLSSFKREKNYQNHFISHFYVNVFKCTYIDCNKEYKTKENLILHIKNKHLKIKPFKCSICNSLFSQRNGKIYHERKFHRI